MAGPFDPYLRQAQALFASGDVVKAGQIWQAILKKDPANEEARAGLYKVKAHFDARATQDGLKGEAAPEPAPEPQKADRETLQPASPEINTLLEAGCTLYDAGLLEKAISTWEMVLRQEPENALAKGYIDGARRVLDAAKNPPPAEEAPAPPPAPADPGPSEGEIIDKLLRDGCTLFDMGQTEDALHKWEQILARDPGHALATAYINDARKDLGLPPLEPGEVPAPPPAAPSQGEPPAYPPAFAPSGDLTRAGQLVREGVQIYDMGMLEEASAKWEQALVLEPGNEDAQGYLAMAKRDREAASPAAPAEASRPAAPTLEPRIAAAENLLRSRKLEEAAFAFQLLIENGSRDPRVLQGFQQARALLAAREEEAAAAREALVHVVPAAAPPPQAPVPAQPPRALTTKAPSRQGLNLASLAGQLHLPPWLEEPRHMAIAAGSFLGLLLVWYGYHSWQRDVALKEAVAAAKAVALAPGAKRGQDIPLSQTGPEVRAEGERCLGEDPLTAYYRAQESLRLDPGDAAAAQLLDRARVRLGNTPPVGGQDADKAMKAGDLDGANNALLDLLRQNPDDAELKAKARIVILAIAQRQALNDHFQEARDLLVRGRAMFPQDRTWPARLRLLQDIERLDKADRAAWIPLLG